LSGIINAARAASCDGCWSCGSGGAALLGVAAWPGLIWPVSGAKPDCAGGDGSAACAVAANIGLAVASAAIAAMRIEPFMASSFGWIVKITTKGPIQFPAAAIELAVELAIELAIELGGGRSFGPTRR
jgi:hypothetical protein